MILLERCPVHELNRSIHLYLIDFDRRGLVFMDLNDHDSGGDDVETNRH